MSAGNWGGSAAAGGLDFQAAASAICMAHMACGLPLNWSAVESDIPLSFLAETGGCGDDIALALADGSVVEVQAKRRLKDGPELWSSLLALCQRAHEDSLFYGVLLVGPTTSVAIREQFARDLVRIGQGRMDDLSSLAIKLIGKLSVARIPQSVCSKVRIHTVHVLEQDAASVQSTIAHLANITSTPVLAWDRLKAEGQRLIRLRGRHDVISVAGLIPNLRRGTSGANFPVLVAEQLLDWTLSKTETFAIPAVGHQFSLDNDWIELKAFGQDQPVANLSSLKEALAHYHDASSRRTAIRSRDSFDAETLGYFIRQCVIVAGPGMGKSQLLRRIARRLARKREPSLLVRLRPLAERMKAGETFREAVMHLGLDSSPLKPQDVNALGMQNLTLLLDGLDESGAEQNMIAQAAVALAISYPRCRIVFTTRPIGYETSLLNSWRHYELVPIASSEARRSVELLVDAAKKEESAEVRAATAAATSHLSSHRGHTFEAKSPMLIALLASLALNKVVAAATREGLYGQLFRLIERITVISLESARVSPVVLKAFLQQIGWEICAHPYADAQQILDACGHRLAAELGEPFLKARSICDDALSFWEKAGIVERVRFKFNEAFTFVHKSFGEYAAAQYVISRSSSECVVLLTMMEPEEQWDEVVIFACAMGLGPDVVQLALVRAQLDSGKVTRLLRWVRHSKEPLKADLAEMVLQQVWQVVDAPHSGKALRTGVDLVAAADNLPGTARSSKAYLDHAQWWTSLVGWTCFARGNPTSLDFPSLLAFMESYVNSADNRTVSGGFELNSPVDKLWEEMLIPAAREAVRRGMGPTESLFIERLKVSFGGRSERYVGELTNILKQLGLKLNLPEREDLMAKYFSPEHFEKRKKCDIALLEAIVGEQLGTATTVREPLLQLSAFLYGSSLMKCDVEDEQLATSPFGENEAKQIVQWAARFGSYDYGQLIAESQEMLCVLRGADEFSSIFSKILSVDAPMIWRGNLDSDAKSVISKALLHNSDWIIFLAANLAETLLTAEDAAELVPEVLAKAEGIGTSAAAHIATHFLGEECARNLIITRLKQPLNSGCRYLFSPLTELWTASCEDRIVELITPALTFGPRTAEAALGFVRAWGNAHWKVLIPLLKEAYVYWTQQEEPYPAESGRIPESPRGALLKLLIEENEASHDLLYDAARDRRSEISQPATKALLEVLLKSEIDRNEFVRRLISGKVQNNLLSECLRTRVRFSEQDALLIAGLLKSHNPQTRFAAVGILHPHYLKPNEIKTLAEMLLSDPYQGLRDEGIARLAGLKITSNNV